MTSLPFPVALICAMFVSRNDGMKRQNGWSCDFKKKEKERNHVADFDRLISFGFIRLSPQKGRVTAISDWAAGGHVLNEQSQWSLRVTSSLAHNDSSQFKQCKK